MIVLARRTTLLALVAVLLTAAFAAAARADGPTANPADMRQLSDEALTTKWAYPAYRARVYSRPTKSARQVTRLKLLTSDGFPQPYVVLADWVDGGGRRWFKIRLAMRANGMTGWVSELSLGDLSTVHTQLVIDRKALRVTLNRAGRKIFSARIGVGKSSTGTPAGTFWVTEKFHVKGAPVYGPRAIGTSAYAPSLTDWPGGGVIGLHGTNQPGLVPGRPSHGCIRLKNADILRLYRLVPKGTPIKIV